MIDINNISRIGLGTYRMSLNNDLHFEALEYAVNNGINLIDTSSNYQSGYSELLIGKLWNIIDRKDVFIITKAGYIQGNDLKNFSSIMEEKTTLKIEDTFYYSLDKSFLEKQIKASLNRLNTNYIDGFLIHNPEYYFEKSDLDIDLIYQQLRESLFFLEDLVNQGVIRYYGISSNVLPTQGINLKKILSNKSDFPHFKLIQFPYNLVENEASSDTKDGESLIEFCSKNDITTFSNRPLNTTYESKVLRLANYSEELSKIDFSKEEILFKQLIQLIQDQLIKFGETSKPEDFAPIKFFIENRKKIANPEAVIQAVQGHLIPFIKQLKFDSNDSIQLIQQLVGYWQLYSKQSITNRALMLKAELVQKGKLDNNDHRDIALIACENYIKQGINHVLVGMRKKEYIDKLISLTKLEKV